MIPIHIAKALIFHMNLARAKHDNDIEFLKSSPDMHKYIQDEIDEVVSWLQRDLILTSKPAMSWRKGLHPIPTPVFNKKD